MVSQTLSTKSIKISYLWIEFCRWQQFKKKKSNNFKCLLLNPSEGIGGREMNNDCLEQLQTRFWLKLRLSDAVMLGCA